MQLIVGLGNPGSEYVHTRHNVGFRVVDALAVALSTTFSHQKKVYGQLAQRGDVFILKPETFMNRSGEAVRATLNYFSVAKSAPYDLKKVFVVHDDLDIPLGKFKIQQAKGPKVHNGLLSIIQSLGSDQFINVRVGIENRGVDRFAYPGGKYVLSSFTSAEEDTLKQVIPQINQELLRSLDLR